MEIMPETMARMSRFSAPRPKSQKVKADISTSNIHPFSGQIFVCPYARLSNKCFDVRFNLLPFLQFIYQWFKRSMIHWYLLQSGRQFSEEKGNIKIISFTANARKVPMRHKIPWGWSDISVREQEGMPLYEREMNQNEARENAITSRQIIFRLR